MKKTTTSNGFDYDYQIGEDMDLSKAHADEHETAPPPRFTEPQLVAKMEELGIGRPSTYANLVTVNQKRGYVQKKGKAMAPTWSGMKVAQILEAKIPEFVDYQFTANMESDLDAIGSGQLPRNQFLDDTWKGASGVDDRVNGLMKSIDWDEINDLSVIHLQGGYDVKVSKNGAYLMDPSGEKDEHGYVKSVRLDDDILLDEDGLTPERCAELLAHRKESVERVLGTVPEGDYAGWKMIARDGRYGAYVQLLKVNKKTGDPVKSAKPKNVTIPENLQADETTITYDQAMTLIDNMPRQLGEGFFTGVGKRGAWLGWKKTSKGRASFTPLPEGYQQKTLTLDEAKTIWEKKPAQNKRPFTKKRSK
jgi:DNA topoisomerase-1